MTTKAHIKVFNQQSGPGSVGNDTLLDYTSLAEKLFVSPAQEENTASLIRAQRKSNRKGVSDVTTADAATAEPQRDSSYPLASEFAGSTASTASNESKLRPGLTCTEPGSPRTEPRVTEAQTPAVQNCELVLPCTYVRSNRGAKPFLPL